MIIDLHGIDSTKKMISELILNFKQFKSDDLIQVVATVPPNQVNLFGKTNCIWNELCKHELSIIWLLNLIF